MENNTKVVLTKHAEERLKERNGLNKKSIERMATKALYEGIPHSRTNGRLHKWITSIYMKKKVATNIRLYGDKAYLFKGNVLITVLQIPPNLMKNLGEMVKVQTDNE